jgi:hypothetical protein
MNIVHCTALCIMIYNILYYIIIYQPPSFEVDHRGPQDLRRRTEIIPVKDSHTRINLINISVTVFQGRTLDHAGSEEANGDNSR